MGFGERFCIDSFGAGAYFFQRRYFAADRSFPHYSVCGIFNISIDVEATINASIYTMINAIFEIVEAKP